MKPRILIVALIALFITSCATRKEVIENTSNTSTNTTVKEVLKDSLFTTPEATSSFTADVVVDTQGNVTLTNTASTSNDIIKAPDVKIKDNKLTVDCETYAQEYLAEWIETHSNTITETKTVKTITKEVERKPNWWENLETWMGRIFMLLIVVFAIGLIIFKLKK